MVAISWLYEKLGPMTKKTLKLVAENRDFAQNFQIAAQFEP